MELLGGHLPELVIVLVVILIIWGPGKLPDIGAGLGKGIREFRKASSEAPNPVTVAAATATASQQTAVVRTVAVPAPELPAQPAADTADATSHQQAIRG
jgi:sec-independent protein translocase protein TatA